MSSATNVRSLQKAALALTMSLVCLCVLAGAAQAAMPAWKMLAVTGPTNLPPKQDEVQQLTVEGEGGTFTLSAQMAKGTGTLNAGLGIFELKEGSDEATFLLGIEGLETPKVGMAVVSGEVPPGTTVTAVNGATVTFSHAFEGPTEEGYLALASKEVTDVSTSLGAFQVGAPISGEEVPSGTTITAVGAGTLTLSQYPSGGGSAVALSVSETTAPVAYNASAADLQSALEALPASPPGMFTVNGGPGGTAEHPWTISFGGPLAEQNVEELGVDIGSVVGEHAASHVLTTVPGGPGTGAISIDPANIGGAPTAGEYTVHLGPLPPGIVTAGLAEGEKWSCTGGAGESTVTCTATEPVEPLSSVSNLNVPVEVEPSAASISSAPVSISGAGGGSASYQMSIVVSTQKPSPGVAGFWAGTFDENGNPEVQAGGHPYSAATYFRVNTVRAVSGKINPVGDPRDVVVDLPPGFSGDPLVSQRCPQSEVVLPNYVGSPLCNEEMTVGKFSPILNEFGAQGRAVNTPLWDDVPAHGYAGEFTTKIGYPLVSLLASLRSTEDFGITITAPNSPNYDKIYGAFAALEGIPTSAHGKSFLRNLTDCAETAREVPVARTKFDTWQEPGNFTENADLELPPVTGCKVLTEAWQGNGPEPEKEAPSFAATPTGTQGSSTTGLNAHLHVPQAGLIDPSKLAPSDLKKVVVSLPQGLSLNPSAANGLEACSEAQMGYSGSNFPLPNPIRFNAAAVGCPEGSKLGTFEIASPLLEEKLEGTIYLAAQEENPFGSLLALYLVVDNQRFGITLKLAGEVKADPSTGQLTATFDYNPQVPFEDLTLHFRGGGPRSEFATPEVCGHYQATGALTPWSAEGEESAPIQEAGFDVSEGCSSAAATRPFAPSFEAGTTSTQAGGYSPFVIKIARNDGEQELSSLDFTLPEGLVGKLAGIPYCPDAAIEAARAKTGDAERANASCPAASEVGTVDTAAGVGPEPVHVSGHVYLAGAYEGAPLSAVVIAPAVAGPFDLGDVVVRAPLFINRETAQITTKSDPIPTILKGIPLKVRSITITLDRPGFILNPTSCNASSVTTSLTSSNGATATPGNRFQVGGCSALKFKPGFSVSTSGKTSKADGASLHINLVTPHQGPDAGSAAEEANIARVKVELPKALPSRLTTLQKACTAAQFNANPAGCPEESIVGTAIAHTPILGVPLTGPAYFVSHGGEAFPQLVAVLQGQGITVDLVGNTFISKTGITSSTFASVPDVPVNSFELTLPQGKYSALAANGDLCTTKLAMPTEFVAQNGTVIHDPTPISVTGCPGNLSFKHQIKKRTLTLTVYAPAAGKVTATGKGLTTKSKTAKGQEDVTITLKQKHAGKLRTTVRVAFTPATGKDRKKQAKTAKLTFKK
jgi:hypothetical protein